MELWQMDVVARIHPADGTEVKVVTGIDDHSRYCVCARVVARTTAKPVCAGVVPEEDRRAAEHIRELLHSGE